MKTAAEILEENGFDIEKFYFDDEYSSRNLFMAMEAYAKEYHRAKLEEMVSPKFTNKMCDRPCIGPDCEGCQYAVIKLKSE